MLKLPCTVKSELSFLKTDDIIRIVCDIWNIIWVILTIFYFQGSHMWADLDIYKHMATLKIKSDLKLLLRTLKNLWIQILFFRVAKFWLSGLPYLRRGSIDDFLIGVILWFRVLKNENNSQKSSEHNMETFSLQASCAAWCSMSCFPQSQWYHGKPYLQLSPTANIEIFRYSPDFLTRFRTV